MKMSRLLLVAALVVALSTLVVGVASADGGPHGAYTDTTPACAGCHRAHTGKGDRLLLAATEVAFCFTCHGDTGLGAASNVQGGVWLDPVDRQDTFAQTDPVFAGNVVNRGLKGGGFDTTRMDTGLTGSAPDGAPSTSKHILETEVTMWGHGDFGSGPGTRVTLKCTSCHNPHGSGNYRIVRSRPPLAQVSQGVSIPDPENKTYTITSDTGRYYGEAYSDTDIRAISDWCGQCHTRIHGNSFDSPQGDGIYEWIHTTTGNNVSEDWTNGPPACFTCHVVHGTSALAEGPAGQVEQPGNDLLAPPPIGSALLRVDNRGVCQLCHNQGGPD